MSEAVSASCKDTKEANPVGHISELDLSVKDPSTELQQTCDKKNEKDGSNFDRLFEKYHQMMCEKIGDLMIKVHILESAAEQPNVQLSVETKEEDWEEKVNDKVLLKRVARKVENLERMFEKTENLDELFEKLNFMTQDFKSAQHWFSKNLQKTMTSVIDELASRYDIFCERYTLVKSLGDCSEFRDMIKSIIFTVLPNIARILPPPSEGEEGWHPIGEKAEEEEEWDGYVEDNSSSDSEEEEENDAKTTERKAAEQLMLKMLRENNVMLTTEQCEELLKDDSGDSGYDSTEDVADAVDGRWWRKDKKEKQAETVEPKKERQQEVEELTVPVSKITKHLGKTYLGTEIQEVFTKVLLIKTPGRSAPVQV